MTVFPSLPEDHQYLQSEIQDMAQQLEHERMLVGDATTKTLLKEMWLIPSNRKRALLSIALMVWQHMTLKKEMCLTRVNPRSGNK